jgi:tetratricopeptide (TPR) repeat protein
LATTLCRWLEECCMDANDVSRILDRANDLLEEGRPADSLRCLSQIDGKQLEGDALIEAVSLRAWALSELGQHTQAVDAVDQILDLYPDSARLYAARGIALSNADDLEEARRSLEQAFLLDSEDSVAIANLALVYEKLRDYEQALELYEQALNFGVDLDWALQRIAAAQTELGATDEAKQTLRRFLSLVPDDATQWVALGVLHSDDEEFQLALECYAQANEIDPESSWLHLNWGITAVRAKQLDQARLALERLEQIGAPSSRPWLLKAFLLEEEGQFDVAEQAYHQALLGLGDDEPEDLAYALELAIDFHSRRFNSALCHDLFDKAYRSNACTVEVCEAYREAVGEHVTEAMWFSVVVEADYRRGLDEVPDRSLKPGREPTHYMRNFQVIARDHDEATDLIHTFCKKMGEQNARVREFINFEPIDDCHLGIYEIERRALVYAALRDDDESSDE